MWEWFTTNSVWILIASGFVLTLLLFVGDRVRDKIAKAMSGKWQKSAHRNAKRGRMTSRVVLSMLQ